MIGTCTMCTIETIVLIFSKMTYIEFYSAKLACILCTTHRNYGRHSICTCMNNRYYCIAQ